MAVLLEGELPAATWIGDYTSFVYEILADAEQPKVPAILECDLQRLTVTVGIGEAELQTFPVRRYIPRFEREETVHYQSGSEVNIASFVDGGGTI